jgi:ribose-phosphate pyrophosphokinase
MRHLRLFAGNSNIALAERVAAHLGISLGKAEVGTFSDGECCVEIQENVRGMDCFVLQSTSAPANTHLMELLIMVDALRRSSARRITAVIPYYGYGRQDRKVQARAPITAKLVADLITASGTDRVLCLELHAGQIQASSISPSTTSSPPVLLAAIRERIGSEVTVISPDAGGVERARAYAKRLDTSLAIIDKRREKANVSQVMNIIGEVEDRVCIMVDDMADTAGTLTEASRALVEAGARGVFALATHPVLSGPAIKRIEESPIEEMIVTDSIALRADARECKKLKVVSVSGLLAEAIRRINNEESVSSLFI